ASCARRWSEPGFAPRGRALAQFEFRARLTNKMHASTSNHIDDPEQLARVAHCDKRTAARFLREPDSVRPAIRQRLEKAAAGGPLALAVGAIGETVTGLGKLGDHCRSKEQRLAMLAALDAVSALARLVVTDEGEQR